MRLELEAIRDEFFDSCQTIVPNLRHLELFKIRNIRDRHLMAISSLKRLKHLKVIKKQLNSLLFTSEGINFLFKNCNQLMTLHIVTGISRPFQNAFEQDSILNLIENPRNVEIIIE